MKSRRWSVWRRIKHQGWCVRGRSLTDNGRRSRRHEILEQRTRSDFPGKSRPRTANAGFLSSLCKAWLPTPSLRVTHGAQALDADVLVVWVSVLGWVVARGYEGRSEQEERHGRTGGASAPESHGAFCGLMDARAGTTGEGGEVGWVLGRADPRPDRCCLRGRKSRAQQGTRRRSPNRPVSEVSNLPIWESGRRRRHTLTLIHQEDA